MGVCLPDVDVAIRNIASVDDACLETHLRTVNSVMDATAGD